jgi:hypothetical protein
MDKREQHDGMPIEAIPWGKRGGPRSGGTRVYSAAVAVVGSNYLVSTHKSCLPLTQVMHSNSDASPSTAERSSSSQSNKKRIQISSSFTTDKEHFYEQIHDNTTNQTTTIKHDTPHQQTTTKTLTTNPYTVETNGLDQTTKQGHSTTLDLEPSHSPATVGYDTSQL